MGVFVDDLTYPGAHVVYSGKYSVWVRLPGTNSDLYVCGVYVPGYPSVERPAAFSEIARGYEQFRDKGRVVIGGDFNSRCAMCGDKTLNTSGRELLSFCCSNSLAIINA